MSEWWTYSPSDFLLFSPDTYYRLFELYNRWVWPGHILALGAGVAILALLRDGRTWRGRAISALLAACWLWVAWAYLLSRYDTINWAARYFAIAFAIEALLLIGAGVVSGALRFAPAAHAAGRLGLATFVFALVAQPLMGPLVGRDWLQAEIFGLAPDPTAVGTLGILLSAAKPVRWELLVIPLLWCVVSGATLWTMGSPDALVLPVAAALGLALGAWKSWHPRARR